VFEITTEGHAFCVGLGGLLQPRVWLQRNLVTSGPFLVDQAERCNTDRFNVFLFGPEVGTWACGASVGWST
jgi:hypothetical protein